MPRSAGIGERCRVIAAGLNRVSIISLGPRPSATLVRDRRLGGRRVSRILLDAADEIERSVKRLVVLRIWWDIGLRPGLLVAFGTRFSALIRVRVYCPALDF